MMRLNSKWFILLSLMLLFSMLGVGQVFADCDDGALAYGDSCEDRFREGDDPRVYSFEGSEGDIVTVTLTWEDDAEGVLLLLGPFVERNQEEFDLNESDDGRRGEAIIEEVELPADGIYGIFVNFTSGDRIDYLLELAGEGGGGGPRGGGGGGISVECPEGGAVENAIAVTISMRAGFNYTVTAVGMDGFNPAIAIGTENGIALCNDDSEDAADYRIDLPTTGRVRGDDSAAQVVFSHNIDSFANINIIIGSGRGETGEFVMILEGLAVTSADGAGDPFILSLTPNLTTASNNTTLYMLGARGLDTQISWVTNFEDLEYFTDNDGNPIFCDDAGNSRSCWGDSESLDGSTVSTSQGDVSGRDTDSMLSFDFTAFADLDFENDGPFSLSFIFGAFSAASTGNYTVVFHFAIGD
ncbi:MAG: hypothetical protein HXY40_10805 [Chloroflexi bacterium]|nr:hypothetical protein [Chloroflexota bacterium]